jgi:hypothetical protein
LEGKIENYIINNRNNSWNNTIIFILCFFYSIKRRLDVRAIKGGGFRMFNEKQIERIKKMYPKGTEIELISMNDSQAVPSGTKGIVDFVDDAGTIQMDWENGSSLGLIVGEDQFKVIRDVELENNSMKI